MTLQFSSVNVSELINYCKKMSIISPYMISLLFHFFSNILDEDSGLK
jgi:hypothetical protein